MGNKDSKIPEDGHETLSQDRQTKLKSCQVEELPPALQPLEDLQSKLFQRSVSDIELKQGF